MTRASKLTLSLFASAALIGTALAAPVAEGGRKFTTELTGEAEVNASGVFNQGDLDGTGTALIIVNHGQSRVCWDITVDGIADATMAHIHRAPVDAPGPIVVAFFNSAPADFEDCASISRELAKELIQHPERFYVNVHNAEFPAGAIRGQLSK